MNTQLARDPINKKLGGVCAGVARHFDIAPLFVRIVAVLALFILPEATLLAYGIAFLILDEEP